MISQRNISLYKESLYSVYSTNALKGSSLESYEEWEKHHMNGHKKCSSKAIKWLTFLIEDTVIKSGPLFVNNSFIKNYGHSAKIAVSLTQNIQ